LPPTGERWRYAASSPCYSDQWFSSDQVSSSPCSLLFGICALVDGGIVLVPALRISDRSARRWLPSAEGAVGVIAGLVTVFWAGMTASGALHYRGVGSCDGHTQDNHHNRAEQRGRERMAACRQRRAVGALRRDFCRSSWSRFALLSATHRCFRNSGGA
jgi:hypothetical protein